MWLFLKRTFIKFYIIIFYIHFGGVLNFNTQNTTPIVMALNNNERNTVNRKLWICLSIIRQCFLCVHFRMSSQRASGDDKR